ncbi:MAG TPA: signal peptidase II [Thermoanaerobaculia bacterium]|nr:signal peptidase II [Thermoanaerobaculia bacterium]
MSTEIPSPSPINRAPGRAPGENAAGFQAGFQKLRYLFVSLAVLVIDQWTKWMIEVHLPDHSAEPLVPGFLNLTHVRNTGVAFGLFAAQGMTGGGWMLTLLGLAALTAVGVYFWFTPSRDRTLLVALAMVVGGAVGNLIDRVVTGAVTDFIDVYVGTHHWPSFNIADSAISIGIALMALDSLKLQKSPGPIAGTGTDSEPEPGT